MLEMKGKIQSFSKVEDIKKNQTEIFELKNNQTKPKRHWMNQ